MQKDQSNWSSEFGSVKNKFNCKFKTNTFLWLNQQFRIWGFKGRTKKKKSITSIQIFKYFSPGNLFILWYWTNTPISFSSLNTSGNMWRLVRTYHNIKSNNLFKKKDTIKIYVKNFKTLLRFTKQDWNKWEHILWGQVGSIS